MSVTMEQINQLSDERQALWRKASRNELASEEYWRLQQISRELEKMWDTHRRHQAADSGERRPRRKQLVSLS